MGKLVSYERSESFSTITMDDGKVNAMSVAMMNEVAIGMTLPYFAVEIARHRLSTPYFHRAAILAAGGDHFRAGLMKRIASGMARLTVRCVHAPLEGNGSRP